MKNYIEETDAEKVDAREKHAALKKVYKDLKRSYSSLKAMTDQEPLRPKQLNFLDSRVRELWTLAQRSNMTEDQLSSFKVSHILALDWFSERRP